MDTSQKIRKMEYVAFWKRVIASLIDTLIIAIFTLPLLWAFARPAYFVSIIPLCLGLIWVGIDRRKQGWHDKLTNTVVVYSEH